MKKKNIMESGNSPEHRIRIKIGLIFLVIILYFIGLFVYSYTLKKNIDAQKEAMDDSYRVLSYSNQLIVSVQHAQDILNMYLASPQKKFSISTTPSIRIYRDKYLPLRGHHSKAKTMHYWEISILYYKRRTLS
jgi:hypothetical protein